MMAVVSQSKTEARNGRDDNCNHSDHIEFLESESESESESLEDWHPFLALIWHLHQWRSYSSASLILWQLQWRSYSSALNIDHGHCDRIWSIMTRIQELSRRLDSMTSDSTLKII